MASILNSGSIITQSSLEQVLLLMNDLAGVSIKATLAPGKAPGTADLILDVKILISLSAASTATMAVTIIQAGVLAGLHTG